MFKYFLFVSKINVAFLHLGNARLYHLGLAFALNNWYEDFSIPSRVMYPSSIRTYSTLYNIDMVLLFHIINKKYFSFSKFSYYWPISELVIV